MSTTPVIAANWKMHKGPEATREFFRHFRPRFDDDAPRLLVFPPALSFAAAREGVPDDPRVELGVQNIHWEDSGAFTGELSASMAAEAGATHVLVGHSERRHVFGESDREVGWKVKAALDRDLVPVVCVGETLEQREAGRVEEVVVEQIDAAIEPIADRDEASFMVAYEPVWAIGTGETATPEDASSAHGTLRRRLGDLLDDDRAAEIPILYGGSVKPHNARDLLAASDVTGVLVGSASLEPDSFSRIAQAV